MSPTQWRMLAQVGTGASGRQLADRLSHGEYDVCRQLRDLIEAGMVELDEAPAAPEPVPHAPASTSDVAGPPVLDTGVDLGPDLASFVAVGATEEPLTIDPVPLVPEVEAGAAPVEESFGAFDAMVETGDVEPAAEPAVDASDEDDFLSELSQLSPKAAAAVEATWGGDAPAAAAEVTDASADEPAGEPAASGDDEIDQNLLLRFLSSTKQ